MRDVDFEMVVAKTAGDSRVDIGEILRRTLEKEAILATDL